MLKRTMYIVITLIGVICFSPLIAASANESITTDVNVMPNADQNLQIDGESYFNYDVSNVKGQDIEASFYIRNLNPEPIDVQVEVADGMTGSGGTVVYETGEETNVSGFNDEGYRMSKLVSDLPETISLNAEETKEVSFTLSVPENAKGQYVGVLRFTKIDGEEEKDTKEGVSIQLKTAYSMGLWFKASDESLVDMTIEGMDVEAKSALPVLYVHLNNPNPHFLKEQQLEYEVIRLEDDKTIFSGEQVVPLIAPKNYFRAAIQWENELRPGKYLLRVNGEEFEFEIDKETVEDIPSGDDSTVIIENNSIPWWMWVLLGGMALSILFILIKKRKESKEEETSEGTQEEKEEKENEQLSDSSDVEGTTSEENSPGIEDENDEK